MNEKLALLELAGEVFALPVSGIEHIVPAPRLFPLPLMRAGFAGVFVDRNEVLPLLDLQHVWGLPRPVRDATRFVVVCASAAGPVGLPAGAVLGIVNRREGALEEGDAGRAFVHGGQRYPLLDVEALLATLPR